MFDFRIIGRPVLQEHETHPPQQAHVQGFHPGNRALRFGHAFFEIRDTQRMLAPVGHGTAETADPHAGFRQSVTDAFKRRIADIGDINPEGKGRESKRRGRERERERERERKGEREKGGVCVLP